MEKNKIKNFILFTNINFLKNFLKKKKNKLKIKFIDKK